MDIQEIRKYLRNEYGEEKKLEELSDHNNFKSAEKAFDYDYIKRKTVKDKCESADALYITKWINFIEFKTGFATKADTVNLKVQKENLKLRIKVKAYESLALFEKVILPKGNFTEDIIAGRRRFIAVIDTKNEPLDGMANILAQQAECLDEISDYKKDLYKWLKDSLICYRKEFDGKHIFYDDTKVWYDYELPNEINKV